MRRKKLSVLRRPGCKDWYIRPRENGKSVWIRLSENKAESERLAKNYERQRLLKRVDGFNPHADVNLVIERYLRDKDITLTTRKSRQRYAVVIRRFQGFLAHRGVKKIVDIKTEIVSDYLCERAREIADKTWNIERLVLSNFCKYCVDHEWAIKNPVSKIPSKKITPPEVEHLNVDEARRLLVYMKKKCYDVPYYEIVATLLHTGMRVNEACYLTKEDVDVKRWLLIVQEKTIGGIHWAPKTKQRRYVPIPREIRSIISQQLNNPGTFLFQNTEGRQLKDRKVLERLKVACRRAGLKEVHVHSLRHTFSSISAEKGIDPRITQKILGHKSGSMTDRYTHLGDDFLGRTMQGFTYDETDNVTDESVLRIAETAK